MNGQTSRLTYLVLVVPVIALVAAGGCRRVADPPPRYPAGGGEGLPPVTLARMPDDKNLLGAIASGDEPAAKAAAEGATRIDDSTAQNLMNGFVEAMKKMEMRVLPGVVIPEQQASVTAMIEATQPLVDAAMHLRQVITSKFPNEKIPVALSAQAGAPISDNVTGVEVTPDPANAEIATATLQVEGTAPVAMNLKLIDGHWKLELPGVPAPEAIEQMKPMVAAVAQGLQGVAARIDSGEIADAQAAMAALGQAMSGQGTPAPAPAPDATAEPPPQTATPPADQPTPNPQKADRPKSELEQDMDNVAGRAVIGGGI